MHATSVLEKAFFILSDIISHVHYRQFMTLNLLKNTFGHIIICICIIHELLLVLILRFCSEINFKCALFYFDVFLILFCIPAHGLHYVSVYCQRT